MLALVLLNLAATTATDVWTLAAQPPIEASAATPLLTEKDIPRLRRALASCPKGLRGMPPPGLHGVSNITVNATAATRGGPIAYSEGEPPRGWCDDPDHRSQCQKLSRGIGLYATNPTTLGDDAVVRVSAYTQCVKRGTNADTTRMTNAVHGTCLWLLSMNRRRGQYSCVTSGAQDPRLVDIAGRRYVMFAARMEVRNGELHRRTIKNDTEQRIHGGIRPFIAPLDDPERAVMLTWSRAAKRVPEKNWLLFAHGDGLYALRWICPQQVLRCDPETGSCRRLEAALKRKGIDRGTHWCSSSEVARLVTSPLQGLHGGAGPVYVREHDVLLALGHKYDKTHTFPSRDYTHYFFTMRPRPPFEIISFSRPFRFPAHYGDARDGIQFCSSMELDGSDLVLAYGVADCVSMTTRVKFASLFTKSGALR